MLCMGSGVRGKINSALTSSLLYFDQPAMEQTGNVGWGDSDRCGMFMLAHRSAYTTPPHTIEWCKITWSSLPGRRRPVDQKGSSTVTQGQPSGRAMSRTNNYPVRLLYTRRYKPFEYYAPKILYNILQSKFSSANADTRVVDLPSLLYTYSYYCISPSILCINNNNNTTQVHIQFYLKIYGNTGIAEQMWYIM